MAANANEQVVRPPAAEQVALAVAEAAGNQPGQAEDQVLVQQVVNAPNDGGGHPNTPALKVSCFISFGRIFKFPHLAGFRFSLGVGKKEFICLQIEMFMSPGHAMIMLVCLGGYLLLVTHSPLT